MRARPAGFACSNAPGGRGERGSAAGSTGRVVSSRVTRHYEYVFPDGAMYVYGIDRGHRLVRRVPLPGVIGVRGVVASPGTHMLYISYGARLAGRGPPDNCSRTTSSLARWCTTGPAPEALTTWR